MYHVGRTSEDRDLADQTFLKNMTLMIENKSRFGFMKRLRMKAAHKFYDAVCRHGTAFFNPGKDLLMVGIDVAKATRKVISAKKL